MTATITNILKTPKGSIKPLVPGRSIHLIDIENLCGSSRLTLEQVKIARRRYMDLGLCRQGDLIVVASSTGNSLSSGHGWPTARLLTRDGKDGADLCLAEVMCEEISADKFERVVIASGDGGLAPFVSDLAGSGVDTVVVSQSKRLSRDMRLAAHKCVVLTPDLEDIA